MKIAIDTIRSPELSTDIDSSSGKSILGGSSINASFEISGLSDNSRGLVRGIIFGSGDNLFANLTAEVQTGKGFSISRSSVTITSN